MYKIYSAEQIIGSVLCFSKTKKIKMSVLRTLERNVRAQFPDVIFAMRDCDIKEAIESYPNVFSKVNDIIQLSESPHSEDRAKSYFSKTIDPNIWKLVLEDI